MAKRSTKCELCKQEPATEARSYGFAELMVCSPCGKLLTDAKTEAADRVKTHATMNRIAGALEQLVGSLGSMAAVSDAFYAMVDDERRGQRAKKKKRAKRARKAK